MNLFDAEGKAVREKIYPKVAEGLWLLIWGGSWVQVPSLLLTELATLSQAPGFLGKSFLIHSKLALETCGIVHRRSPWSGSRGLVSA